MRRLKPEAAVANIHSFLNVSEANGPGRRSVIWFQGCMNRCAGCCNPEMQQTRGGKSVAIQDILGWVMQAKKEGIEGISLTGGEPLLQPDACMVVIQEMRKLKLTTVLYTGYETPERWAQRKVWNLCDIVVAGPYFAAYPDLDRPVGSSNKKLIFHGKRYTHKDLDRWARGEVIVGRTGKIIQTGVMPDLLGDVPRKPVPFGNAC